VGVEPREASERAQKNFGGLFLKKYVRIYVRGCRREDWYSRSDDDDGGLRHLEGRVSVGVTLKVGRYPPLPHVTRSYTDFGRE